MFEPGSQIGRYEIQRRLGRGGMGTVYVAHDPMLGRLVAVKVFLTDLDMPDARQRFAREARASAALNHPNIVTVYDFGDRDGQPFIVMEYIQGDTLASLVRKHAASGLAEKLRWMEDLCAGAAYAHRQGVIHRDLKPTNLIVDRNGRLKILDFGIAKMLGVATSNATALVGTPAYMAPEQILGEPLDQRVDVFAIGIVAYELFSETAAFPGETVATITHRILNQGPVPLAEVCPTLPPELISIVERALRRDSAERWPDAANMGAALRAVRFGIEHRPAIDPDAPTIQPAAHGTAAGADVRPDAQRAPDDAAVAQMTPPPDGGSRPVRADVVRRRTEQVESALVRGRDALAAGDLDGAHDACLQALTLDDTNGAALDLEREISAIQARQRAGQLLGEARDELGRGALTGAFNLLEQARALDSESGELRRLERDLRVARAEQERSRKRKESVQRAVGAAERALAAGDPEAALGFAREALDLQPDSAPAKALEATALARLDDSTSVAAPVLTMLIDDVPTHFAGVAGTPMSAVLTNSVTNAVTNSATNSATNAATNVATNVPVAPVKPAAAAAPKRVASAARRNVIVAAGVAAIAVLATVGVVLIPRGAPAAGTLVLDAVPWATVTSVEAADGARTALPAGAATPLSLPLPAGTYRVRLTGPPPQSESRVITVDVSRDVITTAAVPQFQPLTAADYFEPYLTTSGSGGTTSPTPAVAAGATPPPAAPAPPVQEAKR